jgi:hypothetical protein
MESLAQQRGAGSENYYAGTDQAALNAAFDAIVKEVSTTQSYANVKILTT